MNDADLDDRNACLEARQQAATNGFDPIPLTCAAVASHLKADDLRSAFGWIGAVTEAAIDPVAACPAVKGRLTVTQFA
ncbi:hypothetical protein [Ruegeria atlantica]|uniref:hypothetical protein n=1 Tax=Ruegeria atlantica TaxID=81569 RepID=UPI00071C5BE5|nr:hypothetical protein [Ruegeria atlantica]